jgi:hypothetical protein
MTGKDSRSGRQDRDTFVLVVSQGIDIVQDGYPGTDWGAFSTAPPPRALTVSPTK